MPAVNDFSDTPVISLTGEWKIFHEQCAKLKMRRWGLHFPRTTIVYGSARFASPGRRVVKIDTSIIEVHRSRRIDQGSIDG